MGNQRWLATEQKKISLGVYDEGKIRGFREKRMRNLTHKEQSQTEL